MNKKDLIAIVANDTGLTKDQVERALHAVSVRATQALQRVDEVILPGLGKLEVVGRAARTGRNPRTGDPVAIKASNNVKFKIALSLKKAVQ